MISDINKCNNQLTSTTLSLCYDCLFSFFLLLRFDILKLYIYMNMDTRKYSPLRVFSSCYGGLQPLALWAHPKALRAWINFADSLLLLFNINTRKSSPLCGPFLVHSEGCSFWIHQGGRAFGPNQTLRTLVYFAGIFAEILYWPNKYLYMYIYICI